MNSIPHDLTDSIGDAFIKLEQSYAQSLIGVTVRS